MKKKNMHIVELFEIVKDELDAYPVKHQREIAEACGLSYTAIYSWVEGIVESPRFKNLIEVAMYLGFEFEIKVRFHTALEKAA